MNYNKCWVRHLIRYVKLPIGLLLALSVFLSIWFFMSEVIFINVLAYSIMLAVDKWHGDGYCPICGKDVNK